MKVKKYMAASMPEAMKLIRSDLGNDAVILNSKIIYTGGIFGFFRKKNIEVIAAVDQLPKIEPRIKNKPKMVPSYSPKDIDLEKNSILNLVPEKQETIEKMAKPTEELLDEISEMKEMLLKIASSKQVSLSYPEPIQRMNELLRKQELDMKTREELLATLLEKWYIQGSTATFDEVLDWCRDFMISKISEYKYGELTFSRKYVNVVGPTGVGKTTTLAKIAADCSLKFNKKVAFITTDTFRIAAIDQLKTYAQILSVPLEVCYTLEDFKNACDKLKDIDIVLIDTAGRNFRNGQYVKELEKLIDYNDDMETFLVLSLTSKQADMEEIYQQFSNIPIDQFIFTKVDETSNYGSMYNMIEKYQKGAAYLTNGQNVPDDRIPATAEEITNLILGVEKK